MPKDAKLGLVVGVALVIAVAVVFFRKDGSGRLAVIAEPVAVKPAEPPASPPPNNRPPLPVNQVSLHKTPPVDPPAGETHLVRAGETLFTIAKQRYGDGERFYDIYRVNRDVLKSPDQLSAGVVLRLP